MKVCKITDNAILPTRKYPTDAGLDFYSNEDISIIPFGFGIVHTGITVEVPAGYVAQLWPKSRSDFLVGAGIIDENYQGEVLVKIYNGEGSWLEISEGEAIAQMVLVERIVPEIEEVSLTQIHQRKTARGKNGGIVHQDKIEKRQWSGKEIIV